MGNDGFTEDLMNDGIKFERYIEIRSKHDFQLISLVKLGDIVISTARGLRENNGLWITSISERNTDNTISTEFGHCVIDNPITEGLFMDASDNYENAVKNRDVQ